MRLIDDYPIEILISLALVTATYALAQRLHVSGPLSMVAAGLLIGDRGPRYAMSDQTQRYLFGLWTVIDEILNSILFLLIGLEVLVLSFEHVSIGLAAVAIPIVLFGRLLAVSGPLLVFGWGRLMSIRNVPFLTWAGVRGGVSVARAFPSRKPRQTGNSRRDLFGSPLQHHRAGIDAGASRSANCRRRPTG
jgi:CPA1 family monovalent cation:H+ antiporter